MISKLFSQAMKTQMEDEHPDVVSLKKMGEDLKRIMGEESGARAHVDEQVTDFMKCWNNLANDIREKIRKVCERCWRNIFPYDVFILHVLL